MSNGNGEKEKLEKERLEKAEEAFTNIVERFTILIKQFNIKKAELVADHCAKGDLEDLEDVDSRLREMAVHPSLCSQIVNFWADEISATIPTRLKKKIDREIGLKAKEEAEGEEDRIYTVDPDSGILRLATKDEKATTLAEAKELQKLIKKDLDAERKRKKKEEKDEEGIKEPAFTVGEEGTWTLNPKAQIGVGEFAIFQMYQESLKKGDPIDPIEELARREESSARLKEAMGVKGQDSELSILDKLREFGIIKTGSEGGGLAETLTLLDAMGLIRKAGDGGDTQIVADLRQKIDSINEAIRQKSQEDMVNEITSLRGAIQSVKNDFTETLRTQSAKGEFDIMSQALGVVDRRLGSLEQTITGVFRRPPGAFTSKQKTQLTEAITEEVETETEIEELGTKLFE